MINFPSSLLYNSYTVQSQQKIFSSDGCTQCLFVNMNLYFTISYWTTSFSSCLLLWFVCSEHKVSKYPCIWLYIFWFHSFIRTFCTFYHVQYLSRIFHLDFRLWKSSIESCHLSSTWLSRCFVVVLCRWSVIEYSIKHNWNAPCCRCELSFIWQCEALLTSIL